MGLLPPEFNGFYAEFLDFAYDFDDRNPKFEMSKKVVRSVWDTWVEHDR